MHQVFFKENDFKILTLVYPAKQLPPSVKNILPFSPVIYSTQRQALIKMVSVLSTQWSICCWEVKMNVNCPELWQVLGWPSFIFLQVPPTAQLLHGLEHPDTLNVHSRPGHSWLRLKLKIMPNSQLRNTLDGVPHWTKAMQRSAGMKIPPAQSVTATWSAAAQLGNSMGGVGRTLSLSLPCTALLYCQLHPSLP